MLRSFCSGWATALVLPLLLLLAAPAPAEPSLAKRLEAALAAPGLKDAKVSVLVVDAASGAELFARKPDRALVPASNLKILTALAAASEFGPTHRFVTEVFTGAAPDAEGSVPWLAVRGGGDPTLTSEQWWRLAADLRGLGLRRVAGPILLDAGAFDDEPWNPAWGQASARAYHAPVAALSANYGAYAVVVEPAAEGELARVRIDPPVPYLSVLNQARTSAPGQAADLVVSRRPGPGLERVVVTGRIPAGAEREVFWRSVLDPVAYAGAVLTLQLSANGIAVDGPVSAGPVPEPATLLHAFEGKDMGEVLRLLGKYSSNVIAESLVKSMAARAFGGPGSWEAGTEAMRLRLAALGIPLEEVKLVDGSGLGRGNRVSPRVLVHALRIARSSFRFGPELIAALPIAGADGTLAERAEGAAGAVRAKTGLLDGVTSLSGLAERSDGSVAIFSILVNDFRNGDVAARRAVDRFVEALVGG